MEGERSARLPDYGYAPVSLNLSHQLKSESENIKKVDTNLSHQSKVKVEIKKVNLPIS